jgi:hypothetical protein
VITGAGTGVRGREGPRPNTVKRSQLEVVGVTLVGASEEEGV